MGRVPTNFTSLSYMKASLPDVWKLLEPNDITQVGADITTVPRDPISKDRQRRKGTTTDLDSSVEYEADWTLEQFVDFIECYVFARAVGTVLDGEVLKSGASFNNLAADGTGEAYTHDALSAAILERSLVYGRGFSVTGNNGLSVVQAAGTTTSTPVDIDLTDETPTQEQNAGLEIAGYRGVADDLSITVTGTTAVLASTILDFTTLGLYDGQLIHVGGLETANQFQAGAGYARVTSVAANAVNLDKLDSTLVTDPGTGGEEVDILFGLFVRNVPVDNTADFLEEEITFEVVYNNLQEPSGTGDEYEYPIDNLCNTAAFDLPGQDKATVSFGLVGKDTEGPSPTRKTGADAPIDPVMTGAFNTSRDIARLRIQQADETGITTDFKSLNLTLDNNVTPEKVLGFLGSKYLNVGNFNVDIEAQLLFTSSAVTTAIRCNETLTMDFILTNGDGAVSIDIPSMTLGGGDREFPVNESVLINVTGEAFNDATLGTSIGVSVFPVVPISTDCV